MALPTLVPRRPDVGLAIASLTIAIAGPGAWSADDNPGPRRA